MSIHLFRPAPTAAELAAAYDRIDELTRAVKGMLGLIVLVCNRDDVGPELREVFNTSHRVATAQDAVANQVAS